MRTIKQIKNLLEKKMDLARQLKAVERQIEIKTPKALDEFSSVGNVAIRIDGLTVYPSLTVSAKLTTDIRAEAVQSLKDAGLGAYVAESFNISSVSAHARAALRDDPSWVPPRHFEIVVSHAVKIRQGK